MTSSLIEAMIRSSESGADSLPLNLMATPWMTHTRTNTHTESPDQFQRANFPPAPVVVAAVAVEFPPVD